MPLHARIRAAVIATLLLAASSLVAPAAGQKTDDWLRGSGKDLQICLKGEIVDSDGQPATDALVTGSIEGSVSNSPLKPTIEGNRFTIWFPVNQPDWYSVWLRATLAKGDRIACKTFNEHELRQAAIDGIKLTLQSPTRHVNVRVFDKGQPVAGAIVKAEMAFGIKLQAIANGDGIATFGLLPRQELRRLTAWTDDHRIGGYGFDRSPPRDPNVDVHVVELSKCRDQKLRFVDENGKPVSDIKFVIQTATAPPNYNYIGSNEHSVMTTDAAGEATYQWFPDWDKVHYYADIDPGPWVLDEDEPKSIDGVSIFKLKKSKQRKHVSGRVVSKDASAGGFFVTLESFQAERENHVDRISRFTDPDGRFSVDVLPDATYCAYALDSRWISNMTDLIPYQSATDKLTSPELSVSEGQPIEVFVTSGPKKEPFPNLTVSFRRWHHFTWREAGKTRNGSCGPQWWSMTNESGIATARTLPGEMEVSVFTPRWRTQKTVNVASGEPAKVQLHRKIEEKQIVTGRLVLDPAVAANLKDAEIKIGSVDGNYEDQQTVTCTQDGAFAFSTFAAEVGIFAWTRDGQAAGSIVAKDFGSPIKLPLHPTLDYQGQLLAEGDRPVVGHPVRAIVHVVGNEDYNGRFVKSFEARRIETKSDEQGNYTLRGLPTEVKLYVSADPVDGSTETVDLDEIYLERNESRPRTVSRLKKNANTLNKVPLAQRFKATLRDCALSGFRPMLILAGNSENTTTFVDQNYMDYRPNKDVYPFMQIVVSSSPTALDVADAAFLQEQNWPLPEENHVAAYAFDEHGKELGHLDTDIRRNDAAAEVADFIHHHAPAPADAEAKWNAAFAEAKSSNRRVWVRVSQRYCGPCFRLARWLDDQQNLLNKDYVMLKIDDFRDKNGKDIALRLTRGKPHGVPFHVIYDQAGTMLIDSAGPLGNIGNPSDFEGKKHLRKMLLATRQNLTDAEIDQLVESTKD